MKLSLCTYKEQALSVLSLPTGRKCRVPGHVDNGSFGPVKNTYSFGDKIWFSCIAGYTLQGKKDFICQANGNWNGNFPTCQGILDLCRRTATNTAQFNF